MCGGMNALPDSRSLFEGKQFSRAMNATISAGAIYGVEPTGWKLPITLRRANRELADLAKTLNFVCANLVDDVCGASHAPLMTSFLSLGKTSQSACDKKPVIYPDCMEKPYADQAARILWHRNLLGLTQTEYGEKAGIKRAAINNYESGDFQVGLSAARKLRAKYGLSLDFIYEGIEDALPMNLRNALLENPIVK